MEKNSPDIIYDKWYFRGKLMYNRNPLFDEEYRWHKIQNCPQCKPSKPCILEMPSAEDGTSGKYAIVGYSLEIPSVK